MGRSSRNIHREDDRHPALGRLRSVSRGLLVRAGALALFALSGIVFFALVSHSVSDPSLSVATTSGRIGNLAGYGGAVVSDLLLQLVGGGAFVLPLIFCAWGWQTIRFGIPDGPTPLSAVMKGVAGILAVIAGAGFAAALPLAADWPYLSSMGGILGGIIGGFVAAPLGFLGEALSGFLAGTLLFGFAAWLAATAMGVRREHAEAGLDAFFYCYDWTREEIAYRWPKGWKIAMPQTPGFERRDPSLGEDDAAEAPSRVRREPSLPAPGADRVVDAEIVPDTAEFAETSDDKDTAPTADGDDVSPEGRRRIIREVKKVKPVPVEPGPVFEPENYQLPPLSLLKTPDPDQHRTISDRELEERARLLEGVLADFKINGEIINVRPGPVVTLYELEPAAGVKSSKVIGLADDIARSMSAVACRVAVVPGRNAIGIELPNDDREMVLFHEMLAASGFAKGKNLNLALGKDIGGEPQFADLAKMPHLLIAGTTGSGKSVGINTMILSLLYRLPPDQCKLIMIDPKMLELSVYEGIPHLLAPVVTDPRKAVVALKWTVREMEERYRKMSQVGVRNVHGFNERVAEAERRGEPMTRREHTGYDAETGEPVYEDEVLEYEHMPFIVVVIDEVADLMMVAGKDIEGMVQRLAQMARAAGIHLIMATQRPSVDVITGTIKANFPTRISFQVTSKIDSRTILGEQGAEQLLGMGDMLFMAGGGRITRVHGAFVSDDEVENIVAHLKKQGKPDYVQEVTEGGEDGDDALAAGLGLDMGGNTSSGDALFDQAVAVVVRDRKASTSYIQRRLQIGYNRAASLIEKLEEEGIVSPANHAGKRDILVGEDAA